MTQAHARTTIVRFLTQGVKWKMAYLSASAPPSALQITAQCVEQMVKHTATCAVWRLPLA